MTVRCARVIGGFAVGVLSCSVLAAAQPGAVRSASFNDALTFVSALIGAHDQAERRHRGATTG